MIESILSFLAHIVIAVIESTGYAGIFLLMAAESANIPIPSEVIMPFSGFLASGGTFSFWGVVFVGALGNLGGSLLSYAFAGWVVKNRHRFFIHLLISDSFLATSSAWFKKYGGVSAFFSRLLPIVRTFISLPAGIGKMNLFRFSLYTFIGSFFWSALLTYIGWFLGANWESAAPYFHTFSYSIAALLVLGFGWWMWRHFYKKRAVPKQ